VRSLSLSSWNQHRPGLGVALNPPPRGQPPRVIAIADKAQQRLCRRFRRLTADLSKVAVAIARELAGFLWAALRVPQPA
jgi:transposase